MEWFFELCLARHLAPLLPPFRPVFFLASSRGLSAEREKRKAAGAHGLGSQRTPLPGPLAAGSWRVPEARPSPSLRGPPRSPQGFASLWRPKPTPPPHCSLLEPGAAPRRFQERPQIPAIWFCLRSPASLCPADRSRGKAVLGAQCDWTHPLSLPQASRCSRERRFHQVLGFQASLRSWPWEGSLLISLVNISTRLWPQSGPSGISDPHTAPSLHCLFFAGSSNLTPGLPQLPLHIPAPILARKWWGERKVCGVLIRKCPRLANGLQTSANYD